MKFKGKKPNKGNTVQLVIPRQGAESMLFIAKGIFDYGPFNKQFPEPKPAIRIDKGVESVDLNHPTYKKRFAEWASMKTNWLILESLKATPDLEWETVVIDEPETWGNYAKELDEVLLPAEVNQVVNAVMEACSLTSQKIEEATEAFLSGAGPVLLNGSCQTTEQSNTQSSEPAKDSE